MDGLATLSDEEVLGIARTHVRSERASAAFAAAGGVRKAADEVEALLAATLRT